MALAEIGDCGLRAQECRSRERRSIFDRSRHHTAAMLAQQIVHIGNANTNLVMLARQDTRLGNACIKATLKRAWQLSESRDLRVLDPRTALGAQVDDGPKLEVELVAGVSAHQVNGKIDAP